MASIRALRPADLGAVAELVQGELGEHAPDVALLSATVLEHPWVDPELPSLVATEDDRIVGFIAAQPRRMRFRKRELRAVVCSHLTVAASSRGAPVGALLLMRLLRGEQELTWSDTAVPNVVRVWRRAGGHVDHTRAADWMIVVRPLDWARGLVRAALRRDGSGAETAPVGAIPAHALRARGSSPRRPDGVEGADAAPGGLAAALDEIEAGVALHVDYDGAALEHVRDAVERRLGGAVWRVVRRAGRPIGWYCYLVRPGAAARVLCVQAVDGEQDAVLAELLADARERRAPAVAGRVEPHLELALARAGAALSLSRTTIVHARDPQLLATVASGRSLLSRLDGEWWVP